MKKVGFLISHKDGERRRAILPAQIESITCPEMLFFEKGYGNVLGIEDSEYSAYGCNIVERDEIYSCDIITDVKLSDADYLNRLDDGKVLFGWAHAVQSLDFTSNALRHNHTVIAWEEIYENGRYIFYRNREIAGEAAVMQAFQYCGKMPYDTKVAILGNGQTAKGAMRVLHGLGADVDVYGRKLENLFREKMYEYDVIINCVLWDTNRTDRVIYRENLKKFRQGTMIIDVSCDPHLEIETSRPTTISNPVYEVDGVIHYAVDNTPAMYHKTVSKVLSKGIVDYVNILTACDFEEFPANLQKATVILRGGIMDDRISRFRERNGVFCK